MPDSLSCSKAFHPFRGTHLVQTVCHSGRRKSAQGASWSPGQSRISGRKEKTGCLGKGELVKGCGAFQYIQDWAIAVSTSGRIELMVIVLTVRLTLPLVKVLGAQLLFAVSTAKVLWMPGLPEGRDNLEWNTNWKSLLMGTTPSVPLFSTWPTIGF